MILVGVAHPVKLGHVVGDGSSVIFWELVVVQNVLDAADCIIQPSYVELTLVPGLRKLAQFLLRVIQTLPVIIV
jgi:hypothetical protein